MPKPKPKGKAMAGGGRRQTGASAPAGPVALDIQRLSPQHLQIALDASEIGVWSWDCRTNATCFNPRYFTMLGYDPSLLPQSLEVFLDLVHPQDQSLVGASIAQIFEGRDQSEIEVRLRAQDGQYRWMLARGQVAERDAAGRPLHMVGTHLDITERKTAEQALAGSESRYRALVESQTEAVCRWRPDTTLTFVNDGYCRFFGQRREQLLGRRWIDLVPPEARPEVEAFYRRLVQVPEMHRYAHEVLVGGDQVRVQEWVDCPIFDEHHRLVEFQSVGRDVTDRRRAENLLHRQQELLEGQVKERTARLRQANRVLRTALRERDRHAAQVERHQDQLRVLAAQLALAEDRERRKVAGALHDGLAQDLFALRAKLAPLQAAARSGPARAQVQDVLDLLARMMEDVRSLTLEVCPPVLYEGGFLPALKWLCERYEQSACIPCRLDTNTQSVDLTADVRGLLFQSVRELLTNVSKHARARALRVRIRRSARRLRICVLDDGVGFDSHTLGGRTEGFGIFSIQERLRYLGGSLRITSQPGRGCTACMTLPLRPPGKTPRKRAR